MEIAKDEIIYEKPFVNCITIWKHEVVILREVIFSTVENYVFIENLENKKKELKWLYVV